MLVSASASDGYRFDHWTRTDGTTFDDVTFSFIIHENRTYEAVFVEIPSYTVTVEGGTADVTTAHAGDTVTITANEPATGYAFVQWAMVDGVDYARTDARTTTFAMPAKGVTVTAVFKEIVLPAVEDKTYTGEAIEPTFGLFDVTLDGVDAVFPSRYALTYENNIDVGTATVTLTFKDPLTGNPDSRMGTKSTTFEILPAKLTITGVSASDKEYDSTTDATLDSSSATVSGLASGDDVSLAYTGSFGDANVGSDKPVTVTVTLSGEDAGNYEVVPIDALTASITKRTLTITANNQEYTYNGQIQGEGDTAYEDPAEIAEKVTVTGLQGDDALTSIVIDGQGQDVGEYDLVPSNAAVGAATGNYDIRYVNGKLIIKSGKSTLTFDLGGGTLDGQTGTITIEASVGDTINLPGAPTRPGYTFVCWVGSEYEAGAEYVVPEGGHTFTAKWQKVIPETGDEGGMMLAAFSLVAAASLAVLIVCTPKRRRNAK